MKTLALLFAGAIIFMKATGFAADTESRFFELRTYHAAPGKLEELNARFREHTMKLFERHDMVNIGYWVPVDNTNHLLIYLLAYPSREARETSWKEFQADPDWQAVEKASEANGRLVDKVDSVFLTATDFSPVIVPSPTGRPLLFELRTYHATPGKLEQLLARFRDHTTTLFKQHGMGQFGYWVTADKDGDTLVYILAHKNQKSAEASWKAFRQDPVWLKVKADSEANGSLTLKGGVSSVFMMPTDYSPTK